MLVDKFHRFLNKAIIIAADNRGTNDVFVTADVAAGYAWNSSPIDGTDIILCIPIIGRELRFPLDVDVSPLPVLVTNNAYSVISYLRLVDTNRHFATVIFKILIEDRRDTHAERINNNRNIVLMRPGDIVMARTAVQSDKSKDKVVKLSYAVWGPLQIIRGTGQGGYTVRKLNKHDSPELKFMSKDLHILPPSLKSCQPVGWSDTRYLNQTHAPIVNLLQKPLSIELYNEKWFGHPPKVSFPSFLHDHATLSFLPAENSLFPTLAKLHEDTHTSPPIPFLEDNVVSHDYPLTPSNLHKTISNSNGLFFIQYTLEDTFKSWWFLVK